MKLTFRWYGDDDTVTLDKIRQIPTMSGIVSAVYDVEVGKVWSNESIATIKNKANQNGLDFEVVESVPVHEEIKLGSKEADSLIDNYCENVKRLGQAGVKCICYNFMPVFDWLRSEMEHINSDGSNSLAYDENTVLSLNPQKSELSLPGWDESYTKEQLKNLLSRYENIDNDRLFKNLGRFLDAVIPVAEQYGVNMAIHPDDPPWGIFGLPRIITDEENIDRFLALHNTTANGLTFCTGSLGANPENDLVRLSQKYAKRIHFAHLRNIKITGNRQFQEVGHPSECGSLDMYGIVKGLYRGGFDGYVRPDHGRMIWNEHGRYGYGLYDRALGAMYVKGLFDAVSRES